jgi:uncharacterized protein YecE (DUF72 family)
MPSRRFTTRVGTSGWVYSDWSGVFYPEGLPARSRLAYYAERYDTVEINATHYRLASAPAVAQWQAALPRGFHMVAKGSAFITHRLKLRGCEQPLARFFAPLEGLTSLRCVLWQLPQQAPRDLERVDQFLAILPKHVRHALELRDPWWWSDEVRALCAKHRVALCAVSHPELPETIVDTTDLVYLRFHGLGPTKYLYDYSDDELRPWVERLRPYLGKRDVYVFFNNDYHGHALRNAITFREMLDRARAESAQSTTARSAQSTTARSAQSTTARSAQSTTARSAQSTAAPRATRARQSAAGSRGASR